MAAIWVRRGAGFYQFAYNTANQPATQITSVISQVMFPVFSKMADADPDAGQDHCARVLPDDRPLRHLDHHADCGRHDPVRAGVYHRPVREMWAPAIVPLQLLAIYGYMPLIAANMGSVFRPWASRSGSPPSRCGG